MKRFLFAAACAAVVALVASGCKANNSYREGTNLLLGVYVPTSDGLVGLNVVDYLNGAEVHVSSNMPFRVSRTHAATNSYFGVVHTCEGTVTVIEAKGE